MLLALEAEHLRFGQARVQLAHLAGRRVVRGDRQLLKQLQEIKAGVRPVPLMEPVVAPLSEQDRADRAAFYASPELPRGADPALEPGQSGRSVRNATVMSQIFCVMDRMSPPRSSPHASCSHAGSLAKAAVRPRRGPS